MTPLWFTLIVLASSFAAGLLGALVGIGGGIVVVPLLTLVFKVEIRYAIGASLVAIIATSSGAAAAYVRERMTNLRVAMFLELGTASGAVSGAVVAGLLPPRSLFVVFALVLGYSAVLNLRRLHDRERPVPPDRWADGLRLHGSYFDPRLQREVCYRVGRSGTALGLMYGAGVVSGLLGIGSGVLKVLAMDIVMGLPLKVSSATSNFMIGVTGAASAGVYLARGDIQPLLAAPVAVGVLGGAMTGARLLPRLQNQTVRLLFTAVLLIVAGQMLLRGLR